MKPKLAAGTRGNNSEAVTHTFRIFALLPDIEPNHYNHLGEEESCWMTDAWAPVFIDQHFIIFGEGNI